MDSDTRIKVLGRLAQSRTPAAEEAIGRACNLAFATLLESNEYQPLEFSIEVLITVGFRRSKDAVSAIDNFLRAAESRKLTHSEEYGALAEALSKYHNVYTLMSKCIEVLSGLRYVETPAVVDTLLWLSTHSDESVRRDAMSALRDLARFNLRVYYGQGTDSGRGIGAQPQLLLIAALEKMSDQDLKIFFFGVLTLLEGMLSTSMESATWSSSAVTMSRATVPADEDVLSVRKRGISLLIKLYGLFEIKSQKLSIIRALNAATRAEIMGTVDENFMNMVAVNAQEVLAFFAHIATVEDLQIIQKLEHDSYWIQYHSLSEQVRAAAFQVKTVIDANKEYAIYKILIGFEAVFGDWSKPKRDESFGIGSQDSRVKEARLMVPRIPEEGFDVWRRRILVFARTESTDMATFPVFYEFLGEVASHFPDFALELITNETDQLSKFLIPILRSLWDGDCREKLFLLLKKWVHEASSNQADLLYASAKFFLSTKSVDVDLLGQLLDKAVELNEPIVLRQIVSVAIARSVTSRERSELKPLFLRALDCLTKINDANWIREIWFREEAKQMVADLSAKERHEVMKNLRLLPQIDYQSEELLGVIAREHPQVVVDYLCARVYPSDEDETVPVDKYGSEYEEVPFQFYSLQDSLSSDPEMIIRKVYDCYRKDSSLFEFRGAKLLQAIFPQFSEDFETALIRLIREGGDAELDFAVGILRAYSGETFIHPVARELIKRLPPDSPLIIEVEIALQSTGVVSGEYGMAEAYERKRLEVLEWLQDPDNSIRTFAVKYISRLEAMRDSERARAEESVTLRKFNYGED
ncbi:hypothetical protein [Pseudomonas sp. KK4]|uniref:hypothetical protein n=1 Tax=Pseudomonas sp. KK4 TaxID=1855729 RepID=UPI00097CB354|nr:hypothetical protein [Pseudomonas sp. KK4]